MSETQQKPSFRAQHWAFGLVAAAALALVLVTFVRTWIPGYGLTRFIPIGREFNRRGIAVYRATPKYMDPYPPDRWGFDGQYYAELSLDPLLLNPQLKTALDNPPYRAQRILLSWLAWVGGLGQPYWILNVYAALNGVFWLGYGVILWKLFRPCGWPGVAGFAAMLLTCGVVESIYRTLTDFPAFVLMTLAAMAGGIGGGWLLGLAGLTREVNLLGLPAILEYARPWGRTLRRNFGIALAAIVLPLLWYAYVHWRLPIKAPAGGHPDGPFGAIKSMAGNNFDWPFLAILHRLREVAGAAREGDLVWSEFYRRGSEMHALLTIIATLTQCLYVATHPKWESRLWRVGALFIPFFLCISSNVWAGFSYFTVTRHALPITLAFNLVLAMRPSRRWLVWFVLGNCFVPAGIVDFVRFGEVVPQHRDFLVEAPPPYDASVTAQFTAGWSGPEWSTRKAWRWSTGQRADLVLTNGSRRKLEVQLSFTALTLRPRDFRVTVNGETIWLGRLDQKPQSVAVRTLKFPLPPGKATVTFLTPQPPAPPGADDPRTLSVMVADLEAAATPVP